MAELVCSDCGHETWKHLRTGCAVDSDESWGCRCEQPGTGPRNPDGSWPTWINPAARR